ncbi:MAG: hypothetical protein LBQ84_05560 [Flavobacteriaceae bacterium]|jgi:hypothetical protein|nr:hypothetical protein [Flavobacteriaceae bacterium]
MRKIGLIIFNILCFNFAAFAQDINSILDKQKFETIVQFILTNGDRETYCQMYNNSPHYEYEEGIDIYLDPINQRINFTEEHLSYNISDYNEIVIYDSEEVYGTRYFDIRLKNERVFIEYYGGHLVSEVSEGAKKYISILEKLADFAVSDN